MKNQYSQNSFFFGEGKALCLPAVLVQNYAGLHWKMRQNQQRRYDLQMQFGYENESIQNLCGVITSRVNVNFNTYLLTHSMEQSPSWEANWFCS